MFVISGLPRYCARLIGLAGRLSWECVFGLTVVYDFYSLVIILILYRLILTVTSPLRLEFNINLIVSSTWMGGRDSRTVWLRNMVCNRMKIWSVAWHIYVTMVFYLVKSLIIILHLTQLVAVLWSHRVRIWSRFWFDYTYHWICTTITCSYPVNCHILDCLSR